MYYKHCHELPEHILWHALYTSGLSLSCFPEKESMVMIVIETTK